MVMQAEPIYRAYEALVEKIGKKPRVIYMTPQGQTFNQSIAEDLAKEEDLVFLCGHYEGVDERVLEMIATDYLSAGDYVLTGGELPAMMMIDCISRLVPGVLNNNVSAEFETFHDNLLEYPQYTRPEVFMGKKVPDISFSFVDIVEILIISFLFYHILLWIKNTRAWNLFKGIIVILLFVLVAAIFQMNTILWLAENTLSVGLTALVIIFQPELRKALENLGGKNVLGKLFDFGKVEENKFSDHTIDELIKACYAMGKVKTGALIVIEDEILLNEYVRTGIDIDAIISSQLLINIFEKNTPLHDGAVIVRGDRVVSATCYLPLSDSMTLSKDLGTRHRAAVGISEVSDSLTIVVSEETGKVSIAMRGQIYRNVNADFLRGKLKYLQNRNQQMTKLGLLKRRFMNGKKDSENLGE